MLLTEYNEAEVMELFREEGRQEGREEGRQEGREEGRQEGRVEGIIMTLASQVRDNEITVSKAAVRAGLSEDEFKKKMICYK